MSVRRAPRSGDSANGFGPGAESDRAAGPGQAAGSAATDRAGRTDRLARTGLASASHRPPTKPASGRSPEGYGPQQNNKKAGRKSRRVKGFLAGGATVLLAGSLAAGGVMLAQRHGEFSFDPVAAWEQFWETLSHTGDPSSVDDAGPVAEQLSADEIVALARAYVGADVVVVGDGVPDFSEDELAAATGCFEAYGALDALGRCTVCIASVGPETLPSESRGSIGDVRPSGWRSTRYDDLIEDRYLFNRCHLVAYALTGENARAENLVTGTSHLNKTLMLPREVAVARYVEKSGNHVLYRSTPIFSGTELVCRAVRLEAMSVEDDGAGICLDVLLYNVQPGIGIDYATGASWRAETPSPAGSDDARDGAAEATGAAAPGTGTAPVSAQGGVQDPAPSANWYDALSAADGLGAAGEGGYSRDGLVLPDRTSLAKAKFLINVNSSKFHTPTCQWATEMSARNVWPCAASYTELVEAGFTPCASCL